MSLFYASFSGINDEDVGILFAVNAVVGAVAAPAITRVVDAGPGASKRRLSSVAICVITYAATVAAHLIPIGDSSKGVRLTYFMVLRIIMSISLAPVSPIVDAIAIGKLGEDMYGKERLWGAVSWGLSSLILGSLLDWTGNQRLPVVIGTLTMAIPFLFTVRAFAKQDDVRLRKSKLSDVSNVRGEEIAAGGFGFRDLFCVQGRLTFFVCLFCLSVGVSLVEQMVFLFFAEELNATNFLMGLSVVITVSFEIPLFAIAQKIQRKFSTVQLMVAACAAYAFRVIVYTLIPGDGAARWAILSVEPLHGVTFAFSKLATVLFVTKIAPSEKLAFAQGAAAAIKSAGYFCGLLSGGIIIDRFGNKALYTGASILVAASAIVYGTQSMLWKDASVSSKSGTFELVSANEDGDDDDVEELK